MSETHPNIAIFRRLDLKNISACLNLFSKDVVWHYFNTRLPDLHGDYVGHAGIEAFFRSVHRLTNGNFVVSPDTIFAVGDELVVMKNVNSMQISGQHIEVDTVVVWRIVNGQITEVWDIPSTNG